MLRVHTGENRLLSGALVARVGAALDAEGETQYIVVPKQLTLLTERLLLRELKLPGSFRLRVLSPARLCALVFEAAGHPDGVRVDERGRVMLVRRAIRSAGELTVYRNADRRRGFADRCARQLEIFVQGGVTPEMLRDCAGRSAGMTCMKLNDLAAIYEAYLSLMGGRYQDGESELIEAALRLRSAAFLREGHFWFFGFDLIPPTLMQLIAGVAAQAAAAELFYPVANDPSARGADCCDPLLDALARMRDACASQGVAMERDALPEEPHPCGEIGHLARELYADRVEPLAGEPKHIHMSCARDVREECMLAAAMARNLAMNGLRYGDMQLLCADLDGYRQALIEAFQIYEVPLFLDNSRPVSRMATAECLLTALQLIEKNFRREDVFTLMRTGYMDISRDEADRLANYAIRRGVDGGRWLRPFTRGVDAEIAELEPLRKRLMEPLAKLKAELKDAKDLKGQLAALFGFLTEVRAYEKSLELQQELIEKGMREAAGTLSQAWNRIIGALDQMAALMGEGKLSLRELRQTLTESLDAAVVKPLPQSGDAVYAQSMNRMLMQRAGALFVLGLSDGKSSGEEGLLTEAQRQAVSKQTKAYLGPDERSEALLRRFYLKAALGMATGEVWFSCALRGSDGSAQRPGMTMELVRGIFPGLRPLGSVSGDAQLDRLLATSPRSAASLAARAIAEGRDGGAAREVDLSAAAALREAGRELPEARARMERLESMLRSGEGRESIDPAAARSLYGRLQSQSITRLERFAGCPFSYFATYGLRPDRVEPFELDRRQMGTFLHEAVYEFLRVCGSELNEMDAAQAEARMGRIADIMLEGMRTGTPMEDSASARAESRSLRATACRCARVLAEQMQGSAFRTEQLERSFGREDGPARLQVGDTILEGRIDRVDGWAAGNSLRVIDFKLGGKPLNLAGAYHGLQLQLPVYLGAALKQKQARSAGVYYFALDEGVVNTQSTDPRQVEEERAKSFRMSGLLPEDPELLAAQTPNPERVFQARMTRENKLYSNVPCADDKNFARLIRHVLRKARSQIDAIRGGEAAVSPASFDGWTPCTYCNCRPACLFDPRIDAKRQRRMKNMKWNEVFDQIALEDET